MEQPVFTEEYPPLMFVYEVTDDGTEWRSLGVLDKETALQIINTGKPPAALRARLREIHSGKTKELPTIPMDVTILLRNINNRYQEFINRRIPVGSQIKSLHVMLRKHVDNCDWESVRAVGLDLTIKLRMVKRA